MIRSLNRSGTPLQAWLLILPVVLMAGVFSAIAGGCIGSPSLLDLPPTVTSVTPPTGPTAGGTSITITGMNFQQGATVTIGGATAMVTSVTATQIVAVTPAHAAGAVGVTVTNPNMMTATASGAFTYLAPAPNISLVTPGAAVAGSQQAVVLTITGTNFDPQAVVRLDTTNLTTTFASSTQLTVDVPVAQLTTERTAQITVRNPDAQVSNQAPFMIQTVITSLMLVAADSNQDTIPDDLVVGVPARQTAQLTVMGTNSLGNTTNVTQDPRVNFLSSAASTVSVSNAAGTKGQVSAVAPGQANITAEVPASGLQPPVTSPPVVQRSVPELQITNGVLPQGTDSQLYNAVISAVGGIGSQTFFLSATSSPLPSGLTLDPTTGAITGTTTEGADRIIEFEVRDQSNPGQTATKALNLLILKMLPKPLPAGEAGLAYMETFLESLGHIRQGGVFTDFTVIGGNFPPGLMFETVGDASGRRARISSVPTMAGTFNFTAQVMDQDGRIDTENYTIVIGAQQLAITSTQIECGVGNACNDPILISGGSQPHTCTGSGLPSWLNLDAGTCTLSGTAQGGDGGVSVLNIDVQDSSTPPLSASGQVTLFAPEITLPAFPDGQVGQPYSVNVAAVGGPPSASYGLAFGSPDLPPGLSLNVQTGVVSGTPTQEGTFNFTLQFGAGSAAVRSFQITIGPAPPAPGAGVLLRVNEIGGVTSTGECIPTISRLGLPLVNEQVIPLTCKDSFNLVPDDTNTFADLFRFKIDLALNRSIEAVLASRAFNTGLPANGLSVAFSSSDNGVAAFVSVASNLTSVGNNGKLQVFVHENPATLISATPTGGPGNDLSDTPAISADGRYVVFLSQATNLVANDPTSGFDGADIFLRDTCKGAPAGCTPNTILISRGMGGVPADKRSTQPAISADGRFIAFTSEASNLIIGDTNNQTDIFVHDRDADGDGVFDEPGATSLVRVSEASDGTQNNGPSQNAVLSDNGRFVAFTGGSCANPVTGVLGSGICIRDRDVDGNGIFDEPGGVSTVLVSVSDSGMEGLAGTGNPTISADGRFVAFDSFANNLVPNDTNNTFDVFAVDTCMGAPAGCTRRIVRVSVAADGTQGNQLSLFSAISRDGKYIVFASQSTNFLPGGHPPGSFLFDTYFGLTGLVP